MTQNIILTAVAIQALTTAIGLFFIYSTQDKVNEEILKRNYKLAEKNSLYTFNEGIGDFLKIFIPFYYFFKGLSIIKDSGNFDRTVSKAIASGKYIPQTKEEEKKKEPEVKITVAEPKVEFELSTEKFKAKKNDISLFNSDETPIEYIEKIAAREEEATLTPYVDTPKAPIIAINENPVPETKEELSPADVANFISKMSAEDLAVLQNTIEQLRLLKHTTYQRILEKDVA